MDFMFARNVYSMVKHLNGFGEGNFALFRTKHAGSFVPRLAGSVGEVSGL